MPFLQVALLAAAVAALGAAALRVATACGARGLALPVAAAPLAAGAAVLQALLLGLVSLGASPVALPLAALATWAAVRTRFPKTGAADQLYAWWDARPPADRAALGALGGLLLAWTAWTQVHPYVGLDGLTYHLGLPQVWVGNGSPGSIEPTILGLPVESYPVTHEVLLTWIVGIARGWAAPALAGPCSFALLLAAGWLGLRSFAVSRAVTIATIAAVASAPLVSYQLSAVTNDLTALAWLVCAGALVAQRRPLLVAPAVVAAGLAFGTKTTTALPLALLLGYALWTLRPPAKPLAVAAVAAAALGLIWPLRNLVDHGSPLWPFVAWWGDEIPASLRPYDASFLDHPRAMLDGRLDDYFELMAGTLLILAGAVVALAVRRARWLAAAAVLAILVWANAPYTGIAQDTSLAVGATRYLLPAIAVAAFAVALTGRVALALLGAAIVINLVRDVALGFPFLPGAGTLLLGAALGAAAAVFVPRRLWWGAPVAAAVALAIAIPGYVDRHADMPVFDAGLVRALGEDPRWDDTETTVGMGPIALALVSGPQLEHHVRATATCPARGWLIAQVQPRTPIGDRLARCRRDPSYRDAAFVAFPP